MKTKIKTPLFLLCLISFSNIFAQSEKTNFPEKLTLLLNNNVKMIIESRELLNIPNNKKQDTLFLQLLTDINKVQDSLSKLNAPLVLTYSSVGTNTRKLSVSDKIDTKAEFIFAGNSDTVASSFFNYRIEYNINKNNRLILQTNNLSELNKLIGISYSDLIQQAQTDISSRKIASYKAKTCTYNLNNNTLDITNANIRKQGTFIISSGIDFGISYINDRFLYNTSISFAYIFSPKTETKSMLGFNLELFGNMNPIEPYIMQSNYFVDIFINPKAPNHPLYYATDMKFLIGYLVHREGDVFPKNSWRFGLNLPAGKNFRIELVSYFSDSKNPNSDLAEFGIKYKFF
jgi:hypothetical protein